MLEVLFTLIKMIFTPGFESLLNEIKEAKRKEAAREIEAAKAAAQELHDTRNLQKELGRLSE